MQNFRIPGVYIREVEDVPSPPALLGVAGFVGQAGRGPISCPQVLTRWGQYLEVFGGFTGFSYLAHTVYGFFLNGGERCHVVRVAHETALRSTVDLLDQKGDAAIRVEAADEGSWGDLVRVAVEQNSSDDLSLTELAADLPAGHSAARLKSAAGLTGDDLVGPGGGDLLTLAHADQPFQREVRLRLVSVDYVTGAVTFERPVGRDFPAGSPLLGKGFRLTARFRSPSETEREEIFDNLALNPDHPRYFLRVINGDPVEPQYLKRAQTGQSILIRVQDLAAGSLLACSRLPTLAEQPLTNGSDGPLALTVSHFTGYRNSSYFRPVAPGAGEAERQTVEERLFGLAAYEIVSEVGTVAVPDLILPALHEAPKEPGAQPDRVIFAKTAGPLSTDAFFSGQKEVLNHCLKMGERFALLDSPPGFSATGPEESVQSWSERFRLLPESRNGALYFPWLEPDAAGRGGSDAANLGEAPLRIPCCGHLAGIYARSEKERGVGKAPANEILKGVVNLESPIGDAQQEILNPLGVNCLRVFPGRGIRVWGARTLTRDSAWCYVNVRRLFLAISKHILTRMQWAVFEPHDRRLRSRLSRTLTLYLLELFRSGTLAGARPEEAFFVKCDAETNPPEAVNRGELRVRIGFAPAHPAEFVAVTVTRTAESITVREEV